MAFVAMTIATKSHTRAIVFTATTHLTMKRDTLDLNPTRGPIGMVETAIPSIVGLHLRQNNLGCNGSRANHHRRAGGGFVERKWSTAVL